MKKKYSKIIIFFLVIFLLLTNTYSSYAAEDNIGQIKNILNEFYINPISNEVYKSQSVQDVIKKINDPYMQYYSKDEFNSYINNIDKKISGLGIYIVYSKEGPKIVDFIRNSPGMRAGLKIDDIIVEVKNENVEGYFADVVSDMITGEAGTNVELKVLRNGCYYYFNIMREEFDVPTVKDEVIDDHIAYIKISSFANKTPDEFKLALDDFNRDNVDSYILDLRDNAGGYLDSALDIAGYFIGDKPALITVDKNNNRVIQRAVKHSIIIDKPVIVIVNKNTASSAEVLASAIRDSGKGFLIGNNTYGKGTIQGFVSLIDGSVIKVTMLRFYAPNGDAIDKIGIAPDFDTANKDPMKVARLLLMNKEMENDGKYDDTDTVMVNLNGENYKINLKYARDKEFYDIYRFLMNKSINSGKDSYFDGTQWIKMPSEFQNTPWKYYYPQYKNCGKLTNIPLDKVFLITFSEDMDMNTIDNDNIELVNSSNGEKVPLLFGNFDGKNIIVAPSQKLAKNTEYYLLIHNNVKGTNNLNIDSGAATIIQTVNEN